MEIKDILNPPSKSNFANHYEEIKELVYESSRKRPLGRTPVQKLPGHVDHEKWRFGDTTFKGECVKDLMIHEIGPAYGPKQPAILASQPVGEQTKYYDPSTFNPDLRYGIRTPADPSGSAARQLVQWGGELEQAKTVIVQKDFDEFQERHQPQLAKSLQPNKEYRNLPKDYTCGKPSAEGEGGINVEEAYFKQCTPERNLMQQRKIVLFVRNKLKQANYKYIDDLIRAFHDIDKDGSGKISPAELRDICKKIDFPITPQVLNHLLIFCNLIDPSGKINVEDFLRYVDWKAYYFPPELIEGARENESQKEWGFGNPVENEEEIAFRFTTTSSEVGGQTPDDFLVCERMRVAGLPTLRSDLELPKLPKLDDNNNYGDRGTAGTLIRPSPFQKFGVKEKELREPRTKAEMHQLLLNVGMEVEESVFENLWSSCCDSTGRHATLKNFHIAFCNYCFPNGICISKY